MRLILPIIFVIVAAGLFFGLTTGLFAEIDALRLSKIQASADLNEALKLKENFNTLRDQASAIKPSERSQLDLILPQSINTVDLLAQINSIAKSGAMTLADVKIKTNETKAKSVKSARNEINSLGTATFNFNVSGSYGSLRQFLSNLERNFRLVDISTISFNAVDKEPYQYAIELKTYWLK